MLSAAVESARLDWVDGRRRFDEEARDPARADVLYRQLDAVSDELRRRLGEPYTLAELAALYLRSETWARAAVDEHDPARGGRSLAVVTDAAFHQASVRAADYVP